MPDQSTDPRSIATLNTAGRTWKRWRSNIDAVRVRIIGRPPVATNQVFRFLKGQQHDFGVFLKPVVDLFSVLI